MEMKACEKKLLETQLQQLKILKKSVKVHDNVIATLMRQIKKGTYNISSEKCSPIVRTKRKINNNNNFVQQSDTKKKNNIIDLTGDEDNVNLGYGDYIDNNDMMSNDDVTYLDDRDSYCSNEEHDENEENNENEETEEEEDEVGANQESATKTKTFRQQNLMMCYNTSVQYHIRGTIKQLRPEIIDEDVVNKFLFCEQCKKRFTNPGNLANHLSACTENKEETNNKRKQNKGLDVRNSYTIGTKFNVVQLYLEQPTSNKNIQAIADKLNMPYQTIHPWLKTEAAQNQIIRDFALNPKSRRSGKKMKGEKGLGKFNDAEQKLLVELKARRQRGRRCSPRWVSRRMMQIMAETYTCGLLKEEAEKFVANATWRKRFYCRFRLTTRRRTNKKHLSMETRILKWKEYHAKLRLFLKHGDQQDTKYGRYLPENRYNVDQVPCPFGFSDDKTIEQKGAATVQIRGCATTDTEKRMCTLQLLIRARGEQPRLAIIFRGAGQFLAKERSKYDSRVDVYAQNKAWADRPFSIDWAKKTFAAHIIDRQKKEGNIMPNTLLFCDNLDSQVHGEFLSELKKVGGSRYLLVAG
jgi:hypothetical protein